MSEEEIIAEFEETVIEVEFGDSGPPGPAGPEADSGYSTSAGGATLTLDLSGNDQVKVFAPDQDFTLQVSNAPADTAWAQELRLNNPDPVKTMSHSFLVEGQAISLTGGGLDTFIIRGLGTDASSIIITQIGENVT